MRDEIHTLIAGSECKSLATMIAKAHKMETIIQDKSRNFERERMERGMSSPPLSTNFKKSRDQTFSTSRKESRPMSFRW